MTVAVVTMVVIIVMVVMIVMIVLVMVVAHGSHYFTTQLLRAIARRNRRANLQDFTLAAAVIRSK